MPAEAPFGCAIVVLIVWCPGVARSCPPGVLVLGPLGRGSHAGQGQALPVSGPGYLLKRRAHLDPRTWKPWGWDVVPEFLIRRTYLM